MGLRGCFFCSLSSCERLPMHCFHFGFVWFVAVWVWLRFWVACQLCRLPQTDAFSAMVQLTAKFFSIPPLSGDDGFLMLNGLSPQILRTFPMLSIRNLFISPSNRRNPIPPPFQKNDLKQGWQSMFFYLGFRVWMLKNKKPETVGKCYRNLLRAFSRSEPKLRML